LIIPFKDIVDKGLGNGDMNFIIICIIGQSFLVFDQFMVATLRAWLLLYLGNNINVKMISEFLIKITLLPMAAFENTRISDCSKDWVITEEFKISLPR
jgi:ATP-binding cassette subfamily B protein